MALDFRPALDFQPVDSGLDFVPDTGGEGFLAKLKRTLGIQDYQEPLPQVPGEENVTQPEWAKAPEAALRELVGGMVPHDLPSYLKSTLGPAGSAFDIGRELAQGDVSSIPFVGRVPEIIQAEKTPAASKERYLTAMKTLMDVGALAGIGGERIPSRAGPVVMPEPPPTVSMGPGTVAGDVSRALERRFTLQEPPPETPPELAPAQPVEQSLANLPPELPFNPEAGPAPQPEFQMPLRTETAQIAPPPPPVGTPLKPVPLLGPNGETPALEVATQAAPPPAAGAPEPYTPEAAAAREQQPSGAGPAPPVQSPSEPVGGNVAGFEKVYGPGEIEAGGTVSPEDAWDTATARAQSGQAKPYDFVPRARSGAITPEEMGDLIYEHHRLVERAAGMEGTPEYNGASQAAKDFATNVLKPAETAWHQKGMVMQIERPVNLTTMTGMDQLMHSELGRGIKPGEAPKFKRMAEDVSNGESEVSKAVARSDQRVQRHYAKVADIPIEEAAARVKQMLKDCL